MLIHEGFTIGNSIEIKFIKEGLEKRHICLYITNDITTTKKHMEEMGVNANQF